MVTKLYFNTRNIRFSARERKHLSLAETLLERMLNGKLFPQRFRVGMEETYDGLRAEVTSEQPFDPSMIELTLYGKAETNSPLFS